MIHVCIFINSLSSGGAERVTVALSNYLIKHDYHVTLVTTNNQDQDFYPLSDKVKRICLDMTGENKGFKKLSVNLDRLFRIRAVLKENKPDVLIGIMTTSAILSILACLGLYTKVIVSERNYPGRKQASPSWALLRRLLYRFANGHVAQTKETAIWLKKNTGAKNIHIIPNSVSWPLSSYPPIVSPSLFVASNKKLILSIGTKVHQKGFDLLLEAYSNIASRNSDWDLAIVGIDKNIAPNDYEILKNRITNLGFQNRVFLPGCIGNVSDWYKRADVFVLSSRYEGFPNVLLEAMAGECACIAFDCDTGPRDIIQHNFNGLLVEAENVEKLSEALSIILENKKLRKKISQNAINVCENLSEDKIFLKWRNLINSQLP